MKTTDQIQYTGMDKLNPRQRRLLDKIATDYHAKIKKQLRNMTDLTIHLRTHSKTGKAHRYSIHCKAIAPTKIFASTKAEDWSFSKTLHKSLNDLQLEIKKTMKETKNREKGLTPRKL